MPLPSATPLHHLHLLSTTPTPACYTHHTASLTLHTSHTTSHPHHLTHLLTHTPHLPLPALTPAHAGFVAAAPFVATFHFKSNWRYANCIAVSSRITRRWTAAAQHHGDCLAVWANSTITRHPSPAHRPPRRRYHVCRSRRRVVLPWQAHSPTVPAARISRQ